MLGYRRFAKEEYKLFGDFRIWTYDDAVNILASFELECSGQFGDSLELISINRTNMFSFGNPNEIEKKYTDVWTKWNDKLRTALWNGELLYCNVPGYDDEPFDLPEDAGKTVETYSAFRCRDLLRYINHLVKNGELNFNIREFINALNGNSNAPETTRIVNVEIPPSDYLRKTAKKRHEPDKLKHKSLEMYLLDDLSGTCTCTVRQARERIFRDKYNDDPDYLKAETGYSKIMFDREVTKALKEIQKLHGGINRLTKTEGFIAKKVPACKKHPQK